MAKILLANIGNRNLVQIAENGNLTNLKDIDFLPKKSFRDDTEVLLKWIENKEEPLEKYAINILNAVLEKEEIFDKIFLFASNQKSVKSERDKRQDTIYAAEIIKLILAKDAKYANIEVNIVEMQKNPSQVDEQILEFREKITNILSNHSDDEIIICDSGGTPQQKSALKLVTEYVLNKTEKLKFYQVIDNFDDMPVLSQKDDAKLQKLYQYRQIIDAQQIELLIDKGEYSAASVIRASSLKENNQEFKSEEVWKVLQFWHFRIEDRRKDAKKIAEEMLKGDSPLVEDLKEKYVIIENFRRNKTNGVKQTLFNTVFTNPEHYLALCDIFSIADFHFFVKKDYTRAIHAFHVFIEKLINILVENYYFNDFGAKIPNDTDLKNDLFLALHIPLSKDGVPIKLAYLNRYQPNKVFSNLITSFVQINGKLQRTTKLDVERGYAPKVKGIDQLRNKMIHDYEGTDLTEVNSYIPNFEKYVEKWRKELGMQPSSENIFVKANEEIRKELKNSYRN